MSRGQTIQLCPRRYTFSWIHERPLNIPHSLINHAVIIEIRVTEVINFGKIETSQTAKLLVPRQCNFFTGKGHHYPCPARL